MKRKDHLMSIANSLFAALILVALIRSASAGTILNSCTETRTLNGTEYNVCVELDQSDSSCSFVTVPSTLPPCVSF